MDEETNTNLAVIFEKNENPKNEKILKNGKSSLPKDLDQDLNGKVDIGVDDVKVLADNNRDKNKSKVIPIDIPTSPTKSPIPKLVKEQQQKSEKMTPKKESSSSKKGLKISSFFKPNSSK